MKRNKPPRSWINQIPLGLFKVSNSLEQVVEQTTSTDVQTPEPPVQTHKVKRGHYNTIFSKHKRYLDYLQSFTKDRSFIRELRAITDNYRTKDLSLIADSHKVLMKILILSYAQNSKRKQDLSAYAQISFP